MRRVIIGDTEEELKATISKYEKLAAQEVCRNRMQYLYYMWSATHKLLKITKPRPNEIEYSDKTPYPHLDEEGDNITVGDVVMGGSTVGSIGDKPR